MIYPMQELFSGNQNIYFLWGLSDSLPEVFKADTLLNTPDPYPLFSWIIGLVPVTFLAFWSAFLYIILQAVYSFSLFGIADRIGGIYSNQKQLLAFTTLFLLIHANAIWGPYFSIQLGTDLRWIWDSGIAEQGVLRGYLQPSVFGVFFLLSFFLTASRKFPAAILSLAPAAAMHGGYLFLAAMLTIGLIAYARFDKKTIAASALLLVLALPYSAYILHHFVMLDASTLNSINSSVLAGFKENIHLNPANWLNPKLYIQIAIFGIAMSLIWRDKIAKLIVAIFSIGACLTIAAYLFNATTLLSLNPWRFSVILIPISSAILLVKIVTSNWWKNNRLPILVGTGIVCMAIVYFRLFGNGSSQFLKVWNPIHLGALLLSVFAIKWGLTRLTSKPFYGTEYLVITALVVTGITESYVDGVSKESTDEFKTISAVANQPEQSTVYIVPSSWTSFRLNAKKAVFVDENLVYGQALPSITNRLSMLKRATESGDYTEIISAIPDTISIKLITTRNQIPVSKFDSESIGGNMHCFTLR